MADSVCVFIWVTENANLDKISKLKVIIFWMYVIIDVTNAQTEC